MTAPHEVSASPQGIPPLDHGPRRSRLWFVPFLAALVVLLVLLLAPSIFRGRVLSSSDLLAKTLPWSRSSALAHVVLQGEHYSDPVFYFEPWMRFAAGWVKRGTLPLRNPDSSLGVPFLGNAQSALLSPFTVPHYLLAEPVAAWLGALLKLMTAGAGAALLARAFGRSGGASALAGIGYALCGFVVLWLTYPLSSVLVWLPWSLLGVALLEQERPRAGIACVALAFAAAGVGGHPESAFHVGVLTLAYAAVCFVHAKRPQRSRLLGRFVLASALGALLSAPQTLTFADYLLHSSALVARSNEEFKALRLAQPPPLPPWPDVALGLLLLLASGVGFGLARRLGGSRIGLFVALAAGALGGGYATLALREGAWNIAPLLADADYFGRVDQVAGRASYSGPFFFNAANSGWIGAALLLLALLSPAVAQKRDPNLLFCLFAGIACLLIAVDAPPFTQLLQHVPPFGVIVNRRLLGGAALFGALLAAAAWDGLAVLDAERRRALLRLAAALALGLLVAIAAYDKERLPDRSQMGELPEILPAKPGDPVANLTEPRYDATVRGERLVVAGFALDREPLAQVHVKVRSLVDGRAGEADAEVGRDSPQPRHPLLRLYPGSDRAGFRCEIPIAALGGGSAVVEVFAPQRATPLCSRPIKLERPRGFGRALATVPLALLGVLLCLVRGRGVNGAGRLLLAGVAVADLATFARAHLPQIEPARAWAAFDELAKLRSEDGLRFAASLDLLPPNTHLAYGLRSIRGRDVLEVEGSKSLLLSAGGGKSAIARQLGFDPRGPLFPLLGVGRIVVAPDTPVEEADGSIIERGRGAWIVAPKQHPIRARFYSDATRRRADESAAQCLARLGSNSLERLVLAPAAHPAATDAASGAGASNPETEDGARLLRDDPNEIEVEVTAKGAGWLLVTDLASPHFRATIDGAPASIETAFDALIAVRVPDGGGPRRVLLEYSPLPWKIGLVLAGVGVLLLLGVTLGRRAA